MKTFIRGLYKEYIGLCVCVCVCVCIYMFVCLWMFAGIYSLPPSPPSSLNILKLKLLYIIKNKNTTGKTQWNPIDLYNILCYNYNGELCSLVFSSMGGIEKPNPNMNWVVCVVTYNRLSFTVTQILYEPILIVRNNN